MDELHHLMPVGVVLIAALIVVFMDLVVSHKNRYILPWLALTGCVLGIVSVFQTALPNPGTWFASYDTTNAKSIILGGTFLVDGFGQFIWVIACAAGALSVLAAPEHSEESVLSSGEYYGLTLLAVAGMMMLSVSHDWLTLLISLEVMSISTYILTGSSRDDLRSNEAGLKYLVLGAFSTAFMLLGIAFFYGAFGSISLNPSLHLSMLNISERGAREVLVLISMGLILVGALFKVGASPFHFWIPDVYEGAPTAVTGLMAVGVKAAAFAVVARLVFETFGDPQYRKLWLPLLMVIAVLTMLIGNILAMRQSNVKRMLAYSGIAHTGYLLLGFLVLPNGGDGSIIGEHLKAVVFYLFVYGIMTLGAFGVIALIREDGKPLETIDDYTGLAKEHPGISLCMAIFMLSLAGMPPMGGFFAKFMIFRGAIEQGSLQSAQGHGNAIIVASIIGILTSVASLYYYLRVLVAMYMSPETHGHGEEEEPGVKCRYAWNSNILIAAAGLVTLAIGIVPSWFF